MRPDAAGVPPPAATRAAPATARPLSATAVLSPSSSSFAFSTPELLSSNTLPRAAGTADSGTAPAARTPATAAGEGVTRVHAVPMLSQQRDLSRSSRHVDDAAPPHHDPPRHGAIVGKSATTSAPQRHSAGVTRPDDVTLEVSSPTTSPALTAAPRRPTDPPPNNSSTDIAATRVGGGGTRGLDAAGKEGRPVDAACVWGDSVVGEAAVSERGDDEAARGQRGRTASSGRGPSYSPTGAGPSLRGRHATAQTYSDAAEALMTATEEQEPRGSASGIPNVVVLRHRMGYSTVVLTAHQRASYSRPDLENFVLYKEQKYNSVNVLWRFCAIVLLVLSFDVFCLVFSTCTTEWLRVRYMDTYVSVGLFVSCRDSLLRTCGSVKSSRLTWTVTDPITGETVCSTSTGFVHRYIGALWAMGILQLLCEAIAVGLSCWIAARPTRSGALVVLFFDLLLSMCSGIVTLVLFDFYTACMRRTCDGQHLDGAVCSVNFGYGYQLYIGAVALHALLLLLALCMHSYIHNIRVNSRKQLRAERHRLSREVRDDDYIVRMLDSPTCDDAGGGGSGGRDARRGLGDSGRGPLGEPNAMRSRPNEDGEEGEDVSVDAAPPADVHTPRSTPADVLPGTPLMDQSPYNRRASTAAPSNPSARVSPSAASRRPSGAPLPVAAASTGAAAAASPQSSVVVPARRRRPRGNRGACGEGDDEEVAEEEEDWEAEHDSTLQRGYSTTMRPASTVASAFSDGFDSDEDRAAHQPQQRKAAVPATAHTSGDGGGDNAPSSHAASAMRPTRDASPLQHSELHVSFTGVPDAARDDAVIDGDGEQQQLAASLRRRWRLQQQQQQQQPQQQRTPSSPQRPPIAVPLGDDALGRSGLSAAAPSAEDRPLISSLVTRDTSVSSDPDKGGTGRRQQRQHQQHTHTQAGSYGTGRQRGSSTPPRMPLTSAGAEKREGKRGRRLRGLRDSNAYHRARKRYRTFLSFFNREYDANYLTAAELGVPIAGATDWVYDDRSDMYYSFERNMFWDPLTREYYNCPLKSWQESPDQVVEVRDVLDYMLELSSSTPSSCGDGGDEGARAGEDYGSEDAPATLSESGGNADHDGHRRHHDDQHLRGQQRQRSGNSGDDRQRRSRRQQGQQQQQRSDSSGDDSEGSTDADDDTELRRRRATRYHGEPVTPATASGTLSLRTNAPGGVAVLAAGAAGGGRATEGERSSVSLSGASRRRPCGGDDGASASPGAGDSMFLTPDDSADGLRGRSPAP